MIGQRCRLSAKWFADSTQRRKQREGTIVGKSRDNYCWRVRWDGAKRVAAYAKAYIEVLEVLEADEETSST